MKIFCNRCGKIKPAYNQSLCATCATMPATLAKRGPEEPSKAMKKWKKLGKEIMEQVEIHERDCGIFDTDGFIYLKKCSINEDLRYIIEQFTKNQLTTPTRPGRDQLTTVDAGLAETD